MTDLTLCLLPLEAIIRCDWQLIITNLWLLWLMASSFTLPFFFVPINMTTTGVTKGHMGHVRFLTSVEVNTGSSPYGHHHQQNHQQDHQSKQQHHSKKGLLSLLPPVNSPVDPSDSNCSTTTSTSGGHHSQSPVTTTASETTQMSGTPSTSLPPTGNTSSSSHSSSSSIKMMVVSGGDGFEDFIPASTGSTGLPDLNETSGRDDSTNHLLLWSV